jgi:L-malate glycosyltransferase
MSIVNRPMRVMHIISGDLWAGAEAQAYTLLCQLKGAVDLLVVLLNPGALADKLLAADVSTIILPESELSSIAIVTRLTSVMARFRPDVVHTHRQKENILGATAFLINRVIGRAYISVRTAHGAPEFTPRGVKRLQVALDVAVGRWIQAAVVAVSEDLRLKLLPVYGAKKLILVRNGVDAEALAKMASAEKLTSECIDIGIVGRLEAVKRVDLFIEMAAYLVQLAPQVPWQFHVVGDGKLSATLKNSAHSLGLDQRIKFHGHTDSVQSVLSRLKLLVMCSDHEGTPMVALEALALGVPIIAHDIGGLKELLGAEPKALVQQHDGEGYAKAVLQFQQNPFIAQPLPQEYSAEFNAVQIRQMYKHLLGLRCRV